MRHRFALVVVAAVAVGTLASCRYLQGDPTPRPPLVFGVPTSSTAAAGADTLAASLVLDQGCLMVVTPADELLIPIWPAGSVGKISGPNVGVFPSADATTAIAVTSTLLQLTGDRVTAAPADATIPNSCRSAPLFHVKSVKGGS